MCSETRAAHAGHLAQRLGRDGQAVADPARGLDHDVVGAADRDLAGDERDHPATAAAAANGAWLAWQMATASASAAWSGRGELGQRQQRLDHPRDLALVGAAGAAHRALDLLRGVVDAVDAVLAGGEQDDAPRLADREGRADVLTEIQCFERDGVGPVLVDAGRSDARGGWPAGARGPAPAAVAMTPPSVATSRWLRRTTTPKPQLARPGSMPRTTIAP